MKFFVIEHTVHIHRFSVSYTECDEYKHGMRGMPLLLAIANFLSPCANLAIMEIPDILWIVAQFTSGLEGTDVTRLARMLFNSNLLTSL